MKLFDRNLRVFFLHMNESEGKRWLRVNEHQGSTSVYRSKQQV